MATLLIQGSVLSMPDGEVFGAIDQRMPLAAQAEARSLSLESDAPLVVGLDAPVNMLQLEANNPVTVSITSAAGTSQSSPAEFLALVSRAVPITGISLLRVAGQSTTVRLILGQGA